MQVDDTLLTKLEKLSSLKISSQNRQNTITQLNEIVSFVENLNELNLEDENATFTTLQGGTPFREDVPREQNDTAKIILNNAPHKNEMFFIVPAIIE